jgi:hypothetical protein
LLELLVDDDATLVEHEDAGVGDAELLRPGANAVLGVLRLEMLVEQSQRSNDPGTLVGKQRVGDPTLRGERRQRGDRVVADRENGDVRSLEVRGARLQLDELRFAVRSPARAAVKNDQRFPATSDVVQVDRFSPLILQNDVQKATANRRADAAEIEIGDRQN